MRISSRETLLFWVTALAALYGLGFVLGAPRVRQWQTLRREQQETSGKIQLAERLVAQSPQWEARLREIRGKLPHYPADKDVTADLLIQLEDIASRHGLTLPSRDIEKETRHGDLYELAVNCKWEGKLDGIVHFLFDLQEQDAILSASQLSITPNEKRYLRGSFTVSCSYSRTPAGKPDAGRTPAGTP
jgi:Tfp pilus assembly protein PilO